MVVTKRLPIRSHHLPYGLSVLFSSYLDMNAYLRRSPDPAVGVRKSFLERESLLLYHKAERLMFSA